MSIDISKEEINKIKLMEEAVKKDFSARKYLRTISHHNITQLDLALTYGVANIDINEDLINPSENSNSLIKYLYLKINECKEERRANRYIELYELTKELDEVKIESFKNHDIYHNVDDIEKIKQEKPWLLI